ncbi:peptide ABC transporter substrate-binding protein [Corynebacterium uberis]|uniref:peptide ABC transporter substrate-binding protein n=1 Tax=Corynebacterium uberis TaxID=2883169 RepID=UPI0037DCEDFC
MRKALKAASLLLAGVLAACSSGQDGPEVNYVSVNGSEPQNPLLPAGTTETGGGDIIDQIFSGLVGYDTDGKAYNEVATNISTTDATTFKVELHRDRKFSDGSPVQAHNFVRAWDYAVEHSQTGADFFAPIKGFEEGKAHMEGLKVVDDYTFTITLASPQADFPIQLGHSSFFPLPDVAFDDMEAFGQLPVGNGPYKMERWDHNVAATLVPNPEYVGERTLANSGAQVRFYTTPNAAYADVLSGQLDIIKDVPSSAFTTYQDELGDGAVNKPVAVFQGFTIPQNLPHFSGEEGALRRAAISLAINRPQVTHAIFADTRTPARDFTSPVLPGYSADIPGAEVLEFNPQRARELWDKADAISPYEGTFTISYNSDGGHKPWADAVANQLKNNLGIQAEGTAYPDFKSLRDDITNRTITGAFRTGWQGDFPAMSGFLTQTYRTGAGSNDGDYSNPRFDAELDAAASAPSVEEANKHYRAAQAILLKDLPAIPLWYSNVTGGSGPRVSNVHFNWKSVPELSAVVKEGDPGPGGGADNKTQGHGKE